MYTSDFEIFLTVVPFYKLDHKCFAISTSYCKSEHIYLKIFFKNRNHRKEEERYHTFYTLLYKGRLALQFPVSKAYKTTLQVLPIHISFCPYIIT